MLDYASIFFDFLFHLQVQVLCHEHVQHLFCLFWVLHHHLILVRSSHQFTEICLLKVFLQNFCSCLSKYFVSCNFVIYESFYLVFIVVLIINVCLRICSCFVFDRNSRIHYLLNCFSNVIFECLSVLVDIFFSFYGRRDSFISFDFLPILVVFFELSFVPLVTIFINFFVVFFSFSLFLK